MKKVVLLVVMISSLIMTYAVYSVSIGGSETVGKGQISAGIEYSYIFDRDLEFKKADSILGSAATVENIETDRGYQAVMKISYGLLDNLDVYVKLGTADYKAKSDVSVSGVKAAHDVVNTDNNFAYGVGLKGISELGEDSFLGCDLQYFRSKHRAKVNESYEAWVGWPSDTTTYKKVTFQEWHVAVYLAKRIGEFVPYFGVRYSDMRVRIKKPASSGWSDNLKFEADDNFGLFLGTDYKINEQWLLNLEGRFLDETAVSFGITFKF